MASPILNPVLFVPTQLAFSAPGSDEYGPALLFEIVGFALLVLRLASVVGFFVGLVGTIVCLAQK